MISDQSLLSTTVLNDDAALRSMNTTSPKVLGIVLKFNLCESSSPFHQSGPVIVDSPSYH